MPQRREFICGSRRDAAHAAGRGAAYAAFLKQSPWRASALGVRQNFNAIGTEHWYVPRNKIALSQSRVPAGANAREPFTQELGRAYQTRILEAFVTVDQLQKIGR